MAREFLLNWMSFFAEITLPITRWWFQIFFIFTPTWGRYPFWLIFFKWVETTNQIIMAQKKQWFVGTHWNWWTVRHCDFSVESPWCDPDGELVMTMLAMRMDRQNELISGTPFCKWLGSHEGIQQHTVLCIYIVFTIETHVYKHDISVYMHPSSCKSFHHFQQKPVHLPYHLFSTGFDFLPHFNLPPRNVDVVVFAARFSRRRWIWHGSLRILNRQINSVGGITCEVFCCRRFEVRGSTAVFQKSLPA